MMAGRGWKGKRKGRGGGCFQVIKLTRNKGLKGAHRVQQRGLLGCCNSGSIKTEFAAAEIEFGLFTGEALAEAWFNSAFDEFALAMRSKNAGLAENTNVLGDVVLGNVQEVG